MKNVSIKIRRFLLSLAALAMASAAVADSPIILKFSHVVATDTPKGQAAEYFRKIAEERTRGRVRVEIYPDSKLLKDPVELAALQLGAVQMLAPSLSKLGTLGMREFEVFDLPFLFSDYSQLHRVMNGPIGQGLLKGLESKGIVGLAFWDNEFKQMSANRPLRQPADLAGLKMRIQPSRVLTAQMRALGATPQALPFSDTYPALRAGIVDGAENPVSNFHTQKMHEVQKYLTLSDHGYLGYVVLVNRKFWDDLPGDIRDILEAAVKDAGRYANEIAQKKNQEALEAVKRSGKTTIITLTPEEKRQWMKALLPVHQEQAKAFGQDLLQSIYKETGFSPARQGL